MVLVALPGIDGGTIKPLTEGLQTAGAKVTGRIDVASLWTDQGKSAFRVAALESGPSGNTISVDVEPAGDGSEERRNEERQDDGVAKGEAERGYRVGPLDEQFTHVGQVEDTGARADGPVLFQDACVLERHQPAAELHDPRTKSRVP